MAQESEQKRSPFPGGEGRPARILVVRWLPFGIAAITLGRNVFMRRQHADDETLLAHELEHVRQWDELGKIRFLWRYLGAYFKGRLRGLPHWKAYAKIPLEVKARAAAETSSGEGTQEAL
jgi:hypothetical protein